MIPAVLVFITLICLIWFVYEVFVAVKFSREGIRQQALVTRREWVSTGKTRNVRILVSFQTDRGSRELPLGYMSWWGFRHLNPGASVDIIFHPRFRFVVPASLGGLAARSLIAGSLLVASSIITTAFVLAAIAR
jgi:hypothetical protein